MEEAHLRVHQKNCILRLRRIGFAPLCKIRQRSLLWAPTCLHPVLTIVKGADVVHAIARIPNALASGLCVLLEGFHEIQRLLRPTMANEAVYGKTPVLLVELHKADTPTKDEGVTDLEACHIDDFVLDLTDRVIQCRQLFWAERQRRRHGRHLLDGTAVAARQARCLPLSISLIALCPVPPTNRTPAAKPPMQGHVRGHLDTAETYTAAKAGI
mmetsp:Transcript_16783/g.38041  ORF Transcript_16783/g.38041 Transcript_16783/m.38041 type:complete len:213 (+) Transcript_16783:382-1020(+)